MARTIDEIFNETVNEATRRATEADNQDVLNMLANKSKVATWRILFLHNELLRVEFRKDLGCFPGIY